MSFVMKMLASLTLAVALTLPPMPAPDAPETPESTEPEITTREHAPDTDDCPNVLTPPEPRTTSEVPQPGADPTPLPVVVDGPCGVTAPRGFDVPEEVHASAWLVADMDTGEVIAAKDPHGRYRPASIIKVLLAMVALEELDRRGVSSTGRPRADRPAVGIGEAAPTPSTSCSTGSCWPPATTPTPWRRSSAATRRRWRRSTGWPGSWAPRTPARQLLRPRRPRHVHLRLRHGTHLPRGLRHPAAGGDHEHRPHPLPRFRRPARVRGVERQRTAHERRARTRRKTGFTDDATTPSSARRSRTAAGVHRHPRHHHGEGLPREQARLLIDAALPVPAGEGVGLLEPVVVDEEEPAPTRPRSRTRQRSRVSTTRTILALGGTGDHRGGGGSLSRWWRP